MFKFFKNENEEAQQNNQPFKIKEVVDTSYKPEPEDTENVKRSLNKLGYYNPPEGEFTKFTETSMYDGIKKLQKEHKLKVDGRINPEGETIKKMNELLGKKNEKTTPQPARYRIGTLSGVFESGRNPAAIGYDSKGGYSYGTYQMATKQGKIDECIDLWNKDEKYKNYAERLKNAGGNQAAARKEPRFVNEWQDLAKDSNFDKAQEDCILEKNYKPFLRNNAEIKGLDVEQRHPVIKDVIFSTAVQHGENSNVLKNALGQDASQMSDEEIINRTYDERANVKKYFLGLDHQTRENVGKRFPKEKRRALNLLKIKY